MGKVNKRNKVNGVNGAIDTGLVESRPAGGDVRHPRSSPSEILTTKHRYKEESLRIATWNARTLLKAGKLENMKREMARMNINILGVCETRWTDEGDYYSDGYRVLHGGGSEHRNGVAVILDKRTAASVVKVSYEGDRLMLVKLRGKPTDIVIVQVYMPTSEHKEEEVEDMYEKIEELLDRETVGRDYVVVMGDWNAVVGEGKEDNIVGHYGLGNRNERGEKLVDFCRRRQLYIANTWFCQDRRRRYTWTKPGNTGRYQIDYILTKTRFWNSVSNAKSYPGADADSDHNPVVATVRVKLKKFNKKGKRVRYDFERLKDYLTAMDYRSQTNLELETIEEEACNVNQRWQQLKESVLKSANEVLGQKTMTSNRKPWVTTEMIDRMEERRRWKNVNSDEGRKKYRELNNQLRRATDKARQKWWEEQCQELEVLEKSGRSDLLYQKVTQLTKNQRKKKKTACIKDKDGRKLTEPDAVCSRWKQYIEQLYDKENKPTEDAVKNEEEDTDGAGAEILFSEFEKALADLKNGKAEGIDGIPAELLKALGCTAKKELFEICKEIYLSGEWPDDMMASIVIPIEKKQGAQECVEFRTISLVSHASKILLKILTRRLEAKAEAFLGDDQYGFRRGCGTREGIAAMRTLYERSLEYDNKVYVCFVDYEKAFDRVNWVKLMAVLQSIGIDWRDRKLIKNLYWKQTAYVRIGDMLSERCEIGRGVRQGCSLSPLLYNIYDEAMMREALEEVDHGVKVGGQLIKTIRFADDKAVTASSQRGLQQLMDNIDRVTKEYGMKINVKKTKVMCIARKTGGKVRIIIDGQKVEQVSQFRYLGSLISEDGYCEKDIRARIGMGKSAFLAKKILLTSNIGMELKKRIVKSTVWSVMLYGAETWTLTQAEKKRIEAFEMWVWRRMLKISWKEKISNDEVLMKIGEQRNLLNIISQRKHSWIGHILRHDGLLNTILEGRMEGKAARGRKRLNMLSDILKNDSYIAVKRRAEDRSQWIGTSMS